MIGKPHCHGCEKPIRTRWMLVSLEVKPHAHYFFHRRCKLAYLEGRHDEAIQSLKRKAHLSQTWPGETDEYTTKFITKT